jgi:radical SAM-linked protein
MRIRITFSKTGSLRYIGHLDLHQVWERTARRAGLPLAYTQGFHPGPRLQIACALPLGISGQRELVDMFLDSNDSNDWISESDSLYPQATCHRIQDLLQSAAPPGLTILQVEQVDEHSPALQTQVVAMEYEVILPTELPNQEGNIAGILAAASLPRERRGKPYDLRPLILSLEAVPHGMRMILSACEGATGRPEEVMLALGIPPETTHIERTRLIFKNEIESSMNIN